MKKMNYKKPLAEVMDLEVTDILKTSGENVDGTLEVTALSDVGMKVNTAGELILGE